jgi:hypothetical protein
VGVESEESVRRRELIASWIKPERWPTPAWIAKPVAGDRLQDFEAFYAHQLRTRYLELEGDFRSIVANYEPHDVPTAEAIFGCLQAVRLALELKRPDLLTVASSLDLAERYMAWIYPPHILAVRSASTKLRLRSVQPPGWDQYLDLLKDAPPEMQRMPLDEAIGACNRHALNEEISNGLQIRRLRTYRNWSILVLLALLILSPLLVRGVAAGFWPSSTVLDLGRLEYWLPSFSVLLVGMLGGFISGLFQVSGSRITLSGYRESMVKLSVRPMLGGLAALILYVLLSWGLVPAVKTDTAGAYLFVAFLAGFSERYLLRLIDPQPETKTDVPPKPVLSNESSSPVPHHEGAKRPSLVPPANELR